ncbi:MAG: Capsular polysaccharide synthesis enzyme CpsD, exopolysaccharide synthesis [uncultured Acetobacteraceae bacterium]|uniref:non-specific protein-tyrosine kinase n=1 Tax=uncultured Acetobacteraceae bacterium TaxID=169975 RepID=A0A6J4HM24_9PROT|nr:MAG: Capsular polysaccharide synthesis enzyme CpsD, exopolysaccharide synthesis [uncultured Acetobacteraceae bacterium]
MLDRPVESRAPAERRPNPRQAPLSGDPIEPEGLTITALIAALRRRRWVLILCAILFPAAALIAAKQLTPRYTATTSVLYETQNYQSELLRGPLATEGTTDAVIASQVEVIKSLAIARRVARQFNLDDRPEFSWWLRDAQRVNTPWYRLREALAQRVSAVSPDLAALVAPEPPAEAPPKEVAEVNAAEEARNRLLVQVVRNSRVLQIQFTSEDPQLAKDVANMAADLYITDQLESKFTTVRRANDYLGGQVRDLRQELQQTEQQIGELRATSGLQRGQDREGNISADLLRKLNTDLTEMRNRQAVAEARLAAVQRGGGADITALGASNLVSQRAALDAARADLQRLSATLGDRHPDVAAARSRVNDAQRAVGGETSRVVQVLQTEAAAATASVRSLEAQLRQQEARVNQNQTAEIQINALERSAEALRSLLRQVLERSQLTASQNAIEKADARVLSVATLPGVPSFPKVPLFVAAAAVLGALFGLLVIWFLEQADSTIRSGDEVRSALGLPNLALVPMLRRGLLGRHRVEDYVVRKPLSPFAESMRTLRAALWLGAEPPRVVVITAARPGEGKTTTSVALARSAAMNGERVLLIDCDVRQPSLGRVFRAEGAAGVTDLLLGQAVLERIIRRDHLSSLDYIPAGAAEIHSLGLFMSEAMAGLLDRVRRDYDLIVLDAPPALAMADARVVARLADATLLCVKWRDTPRSVVRNSLGLLEDAHARVVGACLTQVDAKVHGRSGYADAEVYHPRYGGYFRE